MSKSDGSCPLAASKVSADVRRTVDAVDAAKEGVPRPLSDEETESKVLAGRLPGLGAGAPGPLHRMGEANAAGGLLGVFLRRSPSLASCDVWHVPGGRCFDPALVYCIVWPTPQVGARGFRRCSAVAGKTVLWGAPWESESMPLQPAAPRPSLRVGRCPVAL